MKRALLSLLPLLLILAIAAGCAKEEIRPVELLVGEHRISVVLPEEWEHVDYGDRHQLRKDLARIMLADLGWPEDAVEGPVEVGLHRLKERERREVAAQQRVSVSGHEAVIVDTWDRISHQYRKRFFFLKADTSLLAVYTMRGEIEITEPAFDTLVASFAFVDSLEQATAGDRESQPQ